MRILVVTPSLGIGGSERLTVRYALGMHARGHEVDIAYGVDTELVPLVTERGIRTHELAGLRLDYRSLPRWTLAVRRVVRELRPDVIHAQSVTAALAARMAAPRTPTVLTLHGIEREEHERLAAILLAASQTVVTAVSQRAAESASRHWPHPAVEVVPTGIDLHELAESAAAVEVERFGSPFYCCVARLEPIKGIDVLIRAFAQVAERFPAAGLTLVGTGSATEHYRAMVASLGIEAQTRFTGVVEDGAPWLARADVAVLPSRREGLPLAALEALGLGRPVIATAVGGTPTLVRDGETGWLVPPDDPDALAAAMLSAAADPGEVERRGAMGKALIAREYSADCLFDTLEARLDAARHGGGRGSDSDAKSPRLKPRPYYYLARAYQRARLTGASKDDRAWQWAGVRIFGYHRVTEEPDVLAVTPEQFRSHLEVLAESDVEPVRLDRALDLLNGSSTGRFACVTFDDGFADITEWAVPLLREFEIPATIFLPTSVIEGSMGYSWYRDPPPALSWDQVTALADDGVVDFGAHTRTHPALTRLDEARARDEIGGSRTVLESRLGRPVTTFSYPAGLYGARELRLVEDAGFRAAVTTRAGVNDTATRRSELRRTMIIWRDGPAAFGAKLAGLLDEPGRATEWLQRRRAARH